MCIASNYASRTSAELDHDLRIKYNVIDYYIYIKLYIYKTSFNRFYKNPLRNNLYFNSDLKE